MEPRLLPRFRLYLFVVMLAGVLMAVLGYADGNKDVTITGIVLTLGVAAVSWMFAMHDEYMDRMGM